MKRFYLMLCFLMSFIGSAWGQETVTKTETVTLAGWKPSDTNILSFEKSSDEGNFVLKCSDVNKYDNSKGVSLKQGSNIDVSVPSGYVIQSISIGIGSRSSSNVETNMYLAYSDQQYSIKQNESTVIDCNAQKTNEASLDVCVKDGVEYSGWTFYITSVSVTYTYTTYPSLTIGRSEAVADNTYVYGNDGCEIGTGEQMNDRANSGSSFKFKVTPEVSGTYSFTSFISTAFSGRYVSLYNGETLIEKKELTTYVANDWTKGKDYTWSVANLVAGQTYEMRVVCEKDASATDNNQYTANVYKMRIVRTPDKTGLIQIPVDMLNISANTTAGDGFDRFYRGVNLNFAGNAVVSEGKNMVTLGAATDKLTAGSITVTVPDQPDADGEYIQQVQFVVNGGIITDDNKTTLLKVYYGDTEITGGTWTASGTDRLIWDAPADVRTLSLKFVDNADEANTPAITQVQVNVYEVKALANNGRLGTIMPAFSKSEVSMRNNGVKYTNSLGKVKVNGSEYNNFEVLYTFDTEITENNEDGRTYYSLTPVTTDPVTGSTINPATGQVTTGATAGTVKVIAYYDGLQEGSTDNANYAYNPVKAEYTLNVVAPAVIEIGDEEKVAKNIHVQEYGNCSINGTWQDGQLMDSSTDGAYVIFKVKPTVDGTYTFTSEIGTVNDERTITLACNDGSSDIFTETKDITNNGNWTNNLGTYTWTVPGLKAGTEYTIKLQGNKKSDVGNNYIVNLYPMTIVRVATQETTTTFNVSDFNYERGAQGIAGVGLNREIGGFTFTFNPNNSQFVKANGYQSFFFRVNESGTLVIAPDAKNSGAKITQVVLKGSFSKNKDQDAIEAITGLTASATEGSCETAIDIANGTLTVTCAGTSAVNITTEALSNAFTVSSIEVTTDRDVTFEKITPTITFDRSEISYAVGSASFVNGVTVTPANFRLAYSITSNGTGSTIKEYTESEGDGVAGTVTIGATAGTETITATFAGNNDFYNPAEATYTLKIIAEEFSVANEQVVYAVNTKKLYSFVTDGAGKVTYTALEGNVNAATSTAGNAITYTSSDENLIKVNAETGELSLGDNWTAGKAVTITATSAAGQTATYTVKLKFETSIEFGVESVNAHLNVGFVEPKATIVPAGVNLVTYSSNNLNIATVNESTGEVTFPASSTGTVSITATIPDNDYYMGSSDTYQIAVGSAISAGEDALKDYQIVSYQDSKYTANTGHKFTVANATVAKKIISGEQFTNVPGIELTFGAYSGLGDVNVGDLHNLGTIWTLGEDKYLAHQTAATYDEETNLPIGGYMAFEPVVSGILTMDLTWYKGQTFVLVDKSTNAIVESYTAGSEYAGEHRFSTPLQAGRTYYLYNKGGKVDGVEVNDVMKFRSASFTPVFLDKVTSIIPSKLTDGKVLFNIMGADYYNGSSVIPSLSTARHDHDDITYKLSDGTYLNMTADGVFEILEAMEGNNNAVTVTITANIEAKTAAPNDDTDGDTDHMHSSVAVCQVTYTKSDIKFAKESIDVTLFAENKGADIVEPALTYTKDDVAYASSNTNAFTVDANTGNLTVGTNPSGETTITATVNNDDILRYYTNNSAQYKINCKNYSHVKINQTEVEMTVGETGVNILRKRFIEVVHERLDKIYRLNENGTFNGDKGERKVYKTIVDQFVNDGVNGGLNTFFVDATKTNTGKNNGSANTNILYVNKEFTMDAKAAGTTTVYVNLEKLAYSENGQEETPTINASFDAVTIPIKVTIKPREFTAENATLRVWDFTKEIDAETLQTFANSNSNYWTYNQNDNTVKTSVIKPTEKDDAAYYEEYGGDKAKFLVGKKAFENHEFDLSVFNENLKQEGSKDVLKLSTYNQSNYDYYTKEELGRQHNHELNIVSDITLNKKSTIKDNNYMPPVDGSNTNFGENSDECYRGINLEGKASFLHVPKVDDNISIMMIADHNSEKTDDFLDFASSGSNQAGLIVGPYKMTDGTYAAGYNYNRLTTVINYAPRTDENGIVTEVAVEPAGGQVNVVSVVAGYIATSGILNKGEGKVPTSAETRTDGYTTVVSPYNIDMTGQKVVKAYICDYYGKDNNKVHMKQIKHIPANTPVMLRGYARDLYALFISEGNKAVDPGIDESFIKNNRLRGNATEDIYVPLEETEVNSDGEVVKYYNYGLSGSKWVKFGTDGTMKAGKAYLRLTEEEWADLQEAMISSAGVSATRLSFEFEDLDVSDDNVSTGIVQVGTQKDVAGDGYYYSINGIRIGKEKPASKGVYIYNGKKIVVR